MRAFLLFAFLMSIAGACAAAPSSRVLVDDFENLSGWSANPADGVKLAIAPDQGVHGQAMRLDFDFVRGGGYAVARKAFHLTLPANYRFHFAVRGVTSPEDLEFKLIDSTGANVWWMNRRNFTFPQAWDSLTTKKRQIEFAWGPIGGGEIRNVAAIEIAITAGSGGRGAVWLDDLTLEELPAPGGVPPRPTATASSFQPGSGPERALDGLPKTAWRSAPGDTAPILTIDLGIEREFSAARLDWAPGGTPREYVFETSEDGERWTRLHEVRNGRPGQNWIHTPESEGHFLRVRARRAAGSTSVALAELRLEEASWAPNANAFFGHMARAARRGLYPRSMLGEQSYWTVLGADSRREEALIDEDGRIEPWKAGPSIEPFLRVDGKLVTWADVTTKQSLMVGELPTWADDERQSPAEGDLPIPTVEWTYDTLTLAITAFVDDSSGLRVRYRLSNRGKQPRKGALELALRPFQVNPPTQFLNTTGGVASIQAVHRDSPASIVLDDREPIRLLPEPDLISTRSFDQGNVVAEFLNADAGRGTNEDPTGRTSALLHVSLRPPFGWGPRMSRLPRLWQKTPAP